MLRVVLLGAALAIRQMLRHVGLTFLEFFVARLLALRELIVRVAITVQIQVGTLLH